MGAPLVSNGGSMNPVMRMTTIASGHTSERSPLTAGRATCKSREVLTQTEDALLDPSESRVGTFHVPACRATAVSTLHKLNGTRA